MMTVTVDRCAARPGIDAELEAYNAAFEELGLTWRWDRTVMRQLEAITVESARITEYVRRHHPHLLTAYPAEFLANVVSETKARMRPPAFATER